MRRLVKSSGVPGHIYPLALHCYDIMPPPPQVSIFSSSSSLLASMSLLLLYENQFFLFSLRNKLGRREWLASMEWEYPFNLLSTSMQSLLLLMQTQIRWLPKMQNQVPAAIWCPSLFKSAVVWIIIIHPSFFAVMHWSSVWISERAISGFEIGNSRARHDHTVQHFLVTALESLTHHPPVEKANLSLNSLDLVYPKPTLLS